MGCLVVTRMFLSISRFPTRTIKRSHFAGGDLTPPLTKGDARPLWKPHNFVPASRGGVNIEFTLELLSISWHTDRMDDPNLKRQVERAVKIIKK